MKKSNPIFKDAIYIEQLEARFEMEDTTGKCGSIISCAGSGPIIVITNPIEIS